MYTTGQKSHKTEYTRGGHSHWCCCHSCNRGQGVKGSRGQGPVFGVGQAVKDNLSNSSQDVYILCVCIAHSVVKYVRSNGQGPVCSAVKVVKQNFLTPVTAVTTAPTRVTTPLDTAEQGGPLVVGQQTGGGPELSVTVQELSHLSCWAGVDTVLHLLLIPHSCLHQGLSLLLDTWFLPFVIHFQLPILFGVCLWLSILTCCQC